MFGLKCLLGLLILSGCSFAEEVPDYVPQVGAFPPPHSGTYLAGELMYMDVVNRRGGIRLDGNPGNRYDDGPLHYFALLPYGMLYVHGAPAELRDIPLGTHVHGYFYVPPKGEEETIPPLPAEQQKHAVKQNHAISLEDDFSFYQRRGQAWKIASIDLDRGKLAVIPEGPLAEDGINKAYTFDIDTVTRVWKKRAMVDLEDLEPGTRVQLNLAWSIGWRDKEFGVSDIWLDEEGRTFATELQRRRHIRYQKQRWVPGWIDAVEHNDFGCGFVTITFFGGMDPSLYQAVKGGDTPAEGAS